MKLKIKVNDVNHWDIKEALAALEAGTTRPYRKVSALQVLYVAAQAELALDAAKVAKKNRPGTKAGNIWVRLGKSLNEGTLFTLVRGKTEWTLTEISKGHGEGKDCGFYLVLTAPAIAARVWDASIGLLTIIPKF
jgi:hypothetical protein